MRLLVVLAVRHKLSLDIFQKEGIKLLDKSRMPESVRERINFSPCSFDISRAKGMSFEKFILQGGVYDGEGEARPIDGVIVLFDSSMAYLLNGVRDAVFAAEVPPIGYAENVRNYLKGKFLILLGNYGLIAELLADATKYQAACLPLRNFHAPEFSAIFDACRNFSLQRTFRNEIIPRFNRLLSRRGPKRRSSYPDVYFKDDRKRYFIYGDEHHSKYETGAAHSLQCLTNGLYRFGNPLDQDRHYNVTVGDSDSTELISSELPNCHDEIVNIKDRSHINMFSNDFHK
jgi:hypothetical protein